MDLTAEHIGDLIAAAAAAQDRMCATISGITETQCREPSLLPGWAEAMWRSMPPGAWLRPSAARAGRRPAWMSVWARWRETEIHHLDLDLGYTHRHWPAEFADLLLPRLLAGLGRRLPHATSVEIHITDPAGPARGTDGPDGHDGEPVTVAGSASAVTCWLLGRTAAAGTLTITRAGQPCPAPQLRPWA